MNTITRGIYTNNPDVVDSNDKNTQVINKTGKILPSAGNTQKFKNFVDGSRAVNFKLLDLFMDAKASLYTRLSKEDILGLVINNKDTSTELLIHTLFFYTVISPEVLPKDQKRYKDIEKYIIDDSIFELSNGKLLDLYKDYMGFDERNPHHQLILNSFINAYNKYIYKFRIEPNISTNKAKNQVFINRYAKMKARNVDDYIFDILYSINLYEYISYEDNSLKLKESEATQLRSNIYGDMSTSYDTSEKKWHSYEKIKNNPTEYFFEIYLGTADADGIRKVKTDFKKPDNIQDLDIRKLKKLIEVYFNKNQQFNKEISNAIAEEKYFLKYSKAQHLQVQSYIKKKIPELSIESNVIHAALFNVIDRYVKIKGAITYETDKINKYIETKTTSLLQICGNNLSDLYSVLNNYPPIQSLKSSNTWFKNEENLQNLEEHLQKTLKLNISPKNLEKTLKSIVESYTRGDRDIYLTVLDDIYELCKTDSIYPNIDHISNNSLKDFISKKYVENGNFYEENIDYTPNSDSDIILNQLLKDSNMKRFLLKIVYASDKNSHKIKKLPEIIESNRVKLDKYYTNTKISHKMKAFFVEPNEIPSFGNNLLAYKINGSSKKIKFELFEEKDKSNKTKIHLKQYLEITTKLFDFNPESPNYTEEITLYFKSKDVLRNIFGLRGKVKDICKRLNLPETSNIKTIEDKLEELINSRVKLKDGNLPTLTIHDKNGSYVGNMAFDIYPLKTLTDLSTIGGDRGRKSAMVLSILAPNGKKIKFDATDELFAKTGLKFTESEKDLFRNGKEHIYINFPGITIKDTTIKGGLEILLREFNKELENVYIPPRDTTDTLEYNPNNIIHNTSTKTYNDIVEIVDYILGRLKFIQRILQKIKDFIKLDISEKTKNELIQTYETYRYIYIKYIKNISNYLSPDDNLYTLPGFDELTIDFYVSYYSTIQSAINLADINGTTYPQDSKLLEILRIVEKTRKFKIKRRDRYLCDILLKFAKIYNARIAIEQLSFKTIKTQTKYQNKKIMFNSLEQYTAELERIFEREFGKQRRLIMSDSKMTSKIHIDDTTFYSNFRFNIKEAAKCNKNGKEFKIQKSFIEPQGNNKWLIIPSDTGDFCINEKNLERLLNKPEEFKLFNSDELASETIARISQVDPKVNDKIAVSTKTNSYGELWDKFKKSESIIRETIISKNLFGLIVNKYLELAEM